MQQLGESGGDVGGAVSLDYDVVIPTHGRNRRLLAAAIASVERQTVAPKAVIVVVDGNRQAADELRLSHPQITFLCLDRASGAAVARQAGIQAASSEWIAFLDDDDLWSTMKQQRTARYLAAHPECQAVRAGVWMFTEEGVVAGINGHEVELRGDSLDALEEEACTAQPLNDLDYLDIEGDSLALMLEFNRGVISTTMVKRELLTDLPAVPAGQRPGDDYLLFCYVAMVTEWHLVKERLGFYRVHAGQDTQVTVRPGEHGLIHARLNAWEVCGASSPRPLTDYGPLYRGDLRRQLWQLAKLRQVRAVRTAYSLFRPLLPRRRDRLAAFVPDPLVWHAKRLLRRWRGTVQPASNPKW